MILLADAVHAVVETTTVARAIHQASARRRKVITGRIQAHTGVPVDITSCAHGHHVIIQAFVYPTRGCSTERS